MTNPDWSIRVSLANGRDVHIVNVPVGTIHTWRGEEPRLAVAAGEALALLIESFVRDADSLIIQWRMDKENQP